MARLDADGLLLSVISAPELQAMMLELAGIGAAGVDSTPDTATMIGLTALGLAPSSDIAQSRALRAALITTGNAGAYAARDLLASPQIGTPLTATQRSEFQALIRACGLDAGTIPRHLREQLMNAADRAEASLAGTGANHTRT